jgi:hypothetical protein
MPDIDETLRDCRMTGAAGEHFVLCQLIRRGFIAAQAPEGVAKMDIVASDLTGARLFAIQVKTRNERGTDGGWAMKRKHEEAVANLFYCFVDLGTSPAASISCYVIPSDKVAEVIRHSHAIWKMGSGLQGQPRKGDTEFRRLLPNFDVPAMHRPEIGNENTAWLRQHGSGWLNPYLDAWHLLGLPQN